jgi:apolipoprotein N-acyltransferase
VRSQPVLKGFILAWLTNYVVVSIAWWNILGYGAPLPFFLISMAISTLVVALAFLADRLLVPRLSGFASTLVYPLAVTSIEFLTISMNPLGSFGAQAYTQYNSPVLLQLLSITGMWGITFMMTWLATTFNFAWERSFSWPEIRRGLAIYVAIMLTVIVYGNIRLALFQPQEGTMRVHGIVAVDNRQILPDIMKAKQENWQAFRQLAAESEDRYFEETLREAKGGAQLVVWPENAIWLAAEDEAALLDRGQQIAEQEGIYLAMGYAVIYPEDEQPSEMKLTIADPAGEVVLEHYKYGGHSIEGIKPGDGVLRTVETPFGTLSGIICWDTNFHKPVLQAGRNGTDILLSPSLEFRAIDPMHAQMATFRAIENGVSLVRIADNGLSIVTDPYGRTVATVDHFTTSERVLVAQVPSTSVLTVYSVIGDLFGWLAVAGFVVITIVAVIQGRKAKQSVAAPPESQPAS